MTNRIRKISYSIVLFLFTLLLLTCANAAPLQRESINTDISIALLKTGKIFEPLAEERRVSSIQLPASLTSIEDRAFEGTSLTTVNLPANVKTIGDDAFANIPTLQSISIPNSVEHIGKNAFKGSNNVTITGAPKGYARAFAQENGIPFNPITSYCALTNPVQITGVSHDNTEEQKLFLKNQSEDENKHKLPTGRMTGELNADRCEIIKAYHIQGRSPPMG